MVVTSEMSSARAAQRSPPRVWSMSMTGRTSCCEPLARCGSGRRREFDDAWELEVETAFEGGVPSHES